MAEWTKEPWEIGSVERADGTPVEDRAIVYMGDRCEANIEGDDAHANARLIAAAPQMAEVLAELEEMEAHNPADLLGGVAGQAIADFKVRMRAALAAARGGPA